MFLGSMARMALNNLVRGIDINNSAQYVRGYMDQIERDNPLHVGNLQNYYSSRGVAGVSDLEIDPCDPEVGAYFNYFLEVEDACLWEEVVSPHQAFVLAAMDAMGED